MKAARAIFDQRDHGTASGQLSRHLRGIARAGNRRPAALFHRVDQRGRVDAAGRAIDERGEGVRKNILRPPVPHHHRGRRAAAERFGLGQERDRQHWLGRCGCRGLREDGRDKTGRRAQRDGPGRHVH